MIHIVNNYLYYFIKKWYNLGKQRGRIMEFKDTSLETKSSLRYGEPMIAEKKYKKTAYDYLKSEFKGDYDNIAFSFIGNNISYENFFEKVRHNYREVPQCVKLSAATLHFSSVHLPRIVVNYKNQSKGGTHGWHLPIFMFIRTTACWTARHA